MSLRALLFIALIWGVEAVAAVQYVEVRAKANIYVEPLRTSDVLATVDVLDERRKPTVLKLASDKREHGYLHVIVPRSTKSGWIYKSYLRAAEGPPQEGGSHRENGGTTGATFAPSCTLPFPAPHSARAIDNACGQEGSGKSRPLSASGALQNRAKNNLCATGTPVDLDVADFTRLQEYVDNGLKLQYGHGKLPEQRDELRKTTVKAKGKEIGEGAVVRYVGYINHPRNSNVGSGETVNCGQSGAANNDIHIDVVKNPEEHICSSVTVEIIPHYRPTLYNVSYLKELQDRPFRFTGQLFFDAAHRPCTSPTEGKENPKRISSWEIHPVYAIDVCKFRDIGKCKAENDAAWLAFHDAINEVSEEDD